MKIQIASDLHFEFYDDFNKIKLFIEELRKNSTADILILAGDIANARNLPEILNIFSQLWKNIIYVHGNHEFYCRRIEDYLGLKYSSNVHVLEDSFVEIDNQRFIGSTLWFKHKYNHYTDGFIQDFQRIYDSDKIGKINEQSEKFLNHEIKENDIVVTHHFPCFQSIAKQWINHPIIKFFYMPMEEVIVNKKPKVWIHGHTHYSFDYEFDSTRIICNPYGYVNRGINPNFDYCKEIEV